MQSRTALPQEEKISLPLQTLLKMEVTEDAGLDNIQRALGLIVQAWNISLQVEAKHADLMEECVAGLVGTGGDDLRQEGIRVLKMLIMRKQIFYPDDKRHVAYAEVTRRQSRLYISAASLSAPDGNLVVPAV